MTRLKEETASASLSATALFEDFSIAVWTLRRLAKAAGAHARMIGVPSISATVVPTASRSRTCWRAVASAWDSVFVSPLR